MNAALRLLVCLGFVIAPTVQAEVFTVGTDGACTHGSILAAIFAAVGNGPAMDDIRLANNQTYTGVIAPVAGHSLRVIGGYTNCAATAPSGRTVVVGTNSGTNGTFSTSGTGDNFALILQNLDLRDSGSAARSGGGLRIEGDFDVSLRNTTISGNRAGRGGGVYLDGSAGATLDIDANSLIGSNTATVSGGGVYCQNRGLIRQTGAILFNTAEDGGSDPAESGNGGGAALYGCTLFQYETAGIRGTQSNTALRHGGGFYLRNAAYMVLNGNDQSPSQVIGNQAADTGGGIAINDDPALGPNGVSQALIRNSWIDSNRARSGGGLGLVAGGLLIMRRTMDALTCHDATYCSSLSFNTIAAAGDICIGAAVFAGVGSEVRIENTFVEENCPDGSGWAFRQRGNSRVLVDSSVVARNGGSSPFFIEGAAFTGLLQIGWSTITGNVTSGRVSFMALPSGIANTGALRIFGSILGEPFQQLTGVAGGGSPPPMDLDFDCLVLDPFFTSPVNPIRSQELAAPYGMVAPTAGNFRLSSGTVAPVDWCDESLGPRANGDADGVTAIYDAPRANTLGIHDVGAYEFVSVRPDAVFANGFE